MRPIIILGSSLPYEVTYAIVLKLLKFIIFPSLIYFMTIKILEGYKITSNLILSTKIVVIYIYPSFYEKLYNINGYPNLTLG